MAEGERETVAALTARVEKLEVAWDRARLTMTRMMLVPAIVLLCCGLMLPFVDGSRTEGPARLLTFGFSVLGWDEDPADKIPFGLGFAGLMIVSVISALIMMGGLIERPERVQMWAATVSVSLMDLGTLVMVAILGGYLSKDADLGVGLWLYLAGVVWTSVMVFADFARSRWMTDPTPHPDTTATSDVGPAGAGHFPPMASE